MVSNIFRTLRLNQHKLDYNRKKFQQQKMTRELDVTSPMTPNDSTTATTEATSTLPESSTLESNENMTEENEIEEDEEKPRSALIGIPSRDPQVSIR